MNMEIHRQNGTLSVGGMSELSAANARSFRNEVYAALGPGLEHIEIDLSQTSIVDSCGLGALVSLYKAANEIARRAPVTMRLLHPPPPVQQILELTRMHQLFDIVPGLGEPGPAPVAPVLPADALAAR